MERPAPESFMYSRVPDQGGEVANNGAAKVDVCWEASVRTGRNCCCAVARGKASLTDGRGGADGIAGSAGRKGKAC